MSTKKDITEMSVEQKLKNLYQLQTMLSQIDRIKTLRGELPLEVADLEDEIEGLTTRLGKYNDEVKTISAGIDEKNAKIAEAKAAVERYKSQLNDVKNNREYDMLTKEIEFQSLEIELQMKRIAEAMRAIDAKKAVNGKALTKFLSGIGNIDGRLIIMLNLEEIIGLPKEGK